MKQNKKELKDILETIELNHSGLRSINGADVEVSNIRIRKSENKIIANVKYIYDEEGKEEIYKNCEYDLDKINNLRQSREVIK